MTTLIVTPAELATAGATVTGDAYRHLFRARRLAVGDRLRVVDGRGAARWAEVAAVDRKSAHLRLLGRAPANEAAFSLELLVAAPRKERASWLVEKATELGVAAVRFVAAERAPRELGPGTRERLLRVAAAAVEQAGRSRVPEVTGVHPWAAVGELLAPFPRRWFLDTGAEGGEGRSGVRGEGSGDPFGEPASGAAAGAVLVGPEGGWSPDEAAALAALGCRPVWLGARVLRIETAAIAAAALLLARG